jgi:hypothetical protein
MLDKQQEFKGFCFNCPDFLAEPDSMKQQLLNPWPLLAANPTLRTVKTNPLTRTFYSYTYSRTPLSDVMVMKQRRLQGGTAQPTAKERDDFLTWAIWLHEHAHLLLLDWTPAKELAKIWLAFCYADIAQLLFSPLKTAKNVWANFLDHAGRFDAIGNTIEFVEELLATEFMLKAMEAQTLSGGMWSGFQDMLSSHEAKWLAGQEEKFPGFQAMHNRIQPFMQLAYNNPPFVAAVMPLLQPVKMDEDGALYILDSREYLNLLLDLIEGAENAEVAKDRLRPLYKEVGYDWLNALYLQFYIAREPRAEKERLYSYRRFFIKQLWKTSRGELEEGYVEDTKDHAWRAAEKFRSSISQGSWLGPSAHFWLHPYVSRGRDFITGTYIADDPDDNYNLGDVKEAQGIILLYEALRQQLLTRKGIICPLALFAGNPQVCLCDKKMRTSLERLYHLAKELFGPGGASDWSELPCRS